MQGRQAPESSPEDQGLGPTGPPEATSEHIQEARENLLRALKDEEEARDRLLETRARFSRLQHMCDHARRMEQHACTREADAIRMAEKAHRQGQAARQRGQSHVRWEAEAHRWEAEARRAALDGPRWSGESHRNDLSFRNLDAEVRAGAAEAETLAVATHNWRQRLEFLRR
jgi:hypothetical protein